jgi:hypothetical protein
MTDTQTKGNGMKKTLNAALKVFRTGNVDKAWEIAQQDEGLLETVTKDQWVAWATEIAKRDETKHIAETILQQMGGQNKIAAMTGAHSFVNRGNGVSFKFKMCRKFNYMRVVLDDALDLYTVTLSKVTKLGESKNEKVTDGVYCDMLKDIFESETGLYLSL